MRKLSIYTLSKYFQIIYQFNLVLLRNMSPKNLFHIWDSSKGVWVRRWGGKEPNCITILCCSATWWTKSKIVLPFCGVAPLECLSVVRYYQRLNYLPRGNKSFWFLNGGFQSYWLCQKLPHSLWPILLGWSPWDIIFGYWKRFLCDWFVSTWYKSNENQIF